MFSDKYIIDNMTKISKCQCWSLSKTGAVAYPENLTDRLKDGAVSPSPLFDALLKSAERNICSLYVDECFVYGVFEFKEAVYVMGPASMRQLSAPGVAHYLKKKQFGSSFPAPYMSIEDFVMNVNFFYGLITGDESDPLNSYHADYYELLNKYIDHQYTSYEFENSEYERRHFPYQMEEALSEQIVNGEDTIKGTAGNTFDQSAWQSGIMSRNSQKQYEYECVCAITLLTRTAIRAGVLESKAYSLSDLILQKLSVSQNTLEMKQVYDYGIKLFTKEIESAKSQKSQNPSINETKDYIAKHIYQKIRLEDIARSVSLNPNYLSSLFKQETGQTISRYILEEKIRRSCNLLKYSNSSISAIAEYIQITPQNYFTKIFREITGTTPAKYRAKYKTSAFKE